MCLWRSKMSLFLVFCCQFPSVFPVELSAISHSVTSLHHTTVVELYRRPCSLTTRGCFFFPRELNARELCLLWNLLVITLRRTVGVFPPPVTDEAVWRESGDSLLLLLVANGCVGGVLRLKIALVSWWLRDWLSVWPPVLVLVGYLLDAVLHKMSALTFVRQRLPFFF